jgi:hypothetical protein
MLHTTTEKKKKKKKRKAFQAKSFISNAMASNLLKKGNLKAYASLALHKRLINCRLFTTLRHCSTDQLLGALNRYTSRSRMITFIYQYNTS